MTKQIKPCLCLRCGHKWEPRTAEPVSCPRCKSFQWKTESPRYARNKILTGMSIDIYKPCTGGSSPKGGPLSAHSKSPLTTKSPQTDAPLEGARNE